MLITSSLKYSVKHFDRLILKLLFRFDKWHVSKLSDRKYAQDIISYINKIDHLNSKSVLEIGCGLGCIIRRIKAKTCIGFDLSPNVVKAAKFLSYIKIKYNMRFRQFDFMLDNIEGKFDVIIMVNWIHNIPSNILNVKLNELIENNLTKCGMVILDTLRNDTYKYNHDINFLIQNLKCKISILGNYEYGRIIHIIMKE